MPSLGESSDSMVRHASTRWAQAVCRLCDAPVDLGTVGKWARYLGVSEPWLRTWCVTAGVSPKASLDFARLLRAVIQANGEERWPLADLLDIPDRRSMERLLARGGLEYLRDDNWPPSVAQFLSAQKYVQSPQLLQAIVVEVSRRDERFAGALEWQPGE